MRSTHGLHRSATLLLLTPLLMILAISAFAADPIKVTINVAGDAVPGATVTAKATVETTDGSAVQSIAWKQVSGVPAQLSNTTTDTVTIVLPTRTAFRNHLIEVLEEPPITEQQLPPNVPVKEHYESGLQNRFTVVASSPFALEHAGALGFDITVTTTSGTYHHHAEVHAHLPWSMSIGLRTVAIGIPVILHGMNQASYDWSMTKPTGSSATLVDATTQNPEFTPDLAGTYEIKVTNLAKGETVTMPIFAGTWQGVIVGQDANGKPVSDPACRACHVQNTPHFDQFTPWAESGHAHVFTNEVNNDSPTAHYREYCLSCHTVGWDKSVNNGGMDDQPDYAALIASGMIGHGDPGNWAAILEQFPKSARMANIQCENCHGPQASSAHAKRSPRISLSSDVCGTCHGEPKRHGRFQQWQLSPHSNFELAASRGTRTGCAHCHSAQGFIAWAENGFTSAPSVTISASEAEPQTCVVCHNPHAVGTTTGPNTNAPMRISGTTPMLDAGFVVNDAGNSAICMTCHNGRRGLRDEDHFNTNDLSRAPHVGPQTDVLVGRNAYFVEVGHGGNHAMIEDSCVTCHMNRTPPPADLSFNYGGTNHTFYASNDICSKCHSTITTESVQHAVEVKTERLLHEIENALTLVMQSQMRSGNAINFGGKRTVRNPLEIAAVHFTESHGRQAIDVDFTDGVHLSHITLDSVKVVRPTGSVELYKAADPIIAKAGWNYFLVHSDHSKGVHNPTFVHAALDAALFALKGLNAGSAAAGSGTRPGIGGGLGTGTGAVSCGTPYVYWAEIAAHAPGAAGSEWRTDLIARNLGSAEASVSFILHQPEGNLTGSGKISGGAQHAFEDVVALLGGASNKGSLEICSNQPLLVTGRNFNQAVNGTFGQDFDGHVADLGLAAGETVNLLGLRQKSGLYRSNISVTNGGKTNAEVRIVLYDAAGNVLNTFDLTVPPGLVIQELEPLKNRANAADIDWGFATVTVMSGSNVRTSASMIDMRTNDPTTIPAKQ